MSKQFALHDASQPDKDTQKMLARELAPGEKVRVIFVPSRLVSVVAK